VAESLEQKIQRVGNPALMLRNAPALRYPFPYQTEWTGWPNEQWAWKNTTVLFDQSHHMTDVYFKGPDVKRLLSDTGINSMANLGRNRAKQFVACNYDGRVIADAVLFGIEDDEYSLVGTPIAPNWVAYQAEAGGYDVEVRHDERSPSNPTGRRTYRYQLNGPRTQDIIEKASGGAFEHIRFFRMGEIEIAGTPLRALNHTMSGVPGEEYTGLELMGPVEHAQEVLDAILRAGEEFGLRRAGARSYPSTVYESGWIPLPTPAIYSGEAMRPYREYLSANSLEAILSIEGSFASDDIEDYYQLPWDLGYGSLLKFDHDFIGRDALHELADAPHKTKVWLRWNNDDVVRIMRDSLFGEGSRPKIIDLPNAIPSTIMFDTVLSDDRVIGLSTWGGYTVNLRQFCSLGMIDESEARDGAEVQLVWGQPDGGAGKPLMEPLHVQTTLRATVSTRPPL
jgi:glycine cleavage system aminomethyltransferase T